MGGQWGGSLASVFFCGLFGLLLAPTTQATPDQTSGIQQTEALPGGGTRVYCSCPSTPMGCGCDKQQNGD